MFTTILSWVLGVSYVASPIITILNNSSSNNRIRRKNFEILPITHNTFTENIKYAVKDYGFLLVPVYNLIKSVKQFIQKDSEFDSEKKSRLEDRGRLVPIKKEEEEPKKTQPTKEVTKAVDTSKESTVSKKETVTKKEKTVEEMTCYERREYFKNEHRKLKLQYEQAKLEGKNTSAIIEKANRVIHEYKIAQKECELSDLKSEKNMILESLNPGMKLIRK